MTDKARDSVNPYEAGALYEPARAAGPKMPRLLVVRGRIRPAERRRAALLAADLAPGDIRDFVIGCVVLVVISGPMMSGEVSWLSASPFLVLGTLALLAALSYCVTYRRTLREVDLIVLVRSEPRAYLALPRSHFASAANWLLCEQAVKHFIRVTRPG